ncbi:MAG TPA: MFS transporter [Candidatus Limnocylindrales bacterium]
MSNSTPPDIGLALDRDSGPGGSNSDEGKASAVLKNRPFLLLWLAQLSTQVGGNMVIYGLTIIIIAAYNSSSAVSVLLVSFLVPAIVFSAMAGVFVDRVDKRLLLVITNILRGVAFLAIVLVGNNLILIYLLMILVSTVTTFFGPAEASMIPLLVPKRQLLSANGLFTLTMNAAFVVGFALLGPILVAVANAQVLIVIVACLYLIAAVFCWTLPSAPRQVLIEATAVGTVADAERAVTGLFSQFREGVTYIRKHHNIAWSLSYLGFAGALVGILGVIGPTFAQSTLGLGPKDFALIVLPMGLGIVMGILFLNSYGKYLPRRRTIEVGMICVGILLAVLACSGPISRFLEQQANSTGLAEASRAVSLLSLVMGLAFFIGAAYAIVAIAAQTQLQEELPEDVRGRVFGVLNMLVSIASLAPLIVAAPVADLVGREPVIFAVGIIVGLWGLASVFSPGSRASDNSARAPSGPSGAPVDLLTVAISPTEITAEAAPATAVAGIDGEPQ